MLNVGATKSYQDIAPISLSRLYSDSSLGILDIQHGKPPSFSSKYNDYLVGETGRGASMYVSTGCLTWKFTKVNPCCDNVFIAMFLCFV